MGARRLSCFAIVFAIAIILAQCSFAAIRMRGSAAVSWSSCCAGLRYRAVFRAPAGVVRQPLEMWCAAFFCIRFIATAPFCVCPPSFVLDITTVREVGEGCTYVRPSVGDEICPPRGGGAMRDVTALRFLPIFRR